MTRNDIIKMAREAGFSVSDGIVTGGSSDLERFAALVAAAAVAAERDSWRKGLEPVFRRRMGAESILEAVQHVIRARGTA